jgi:hypothetical protein
LLRGNPLQIAEQDVRGRVGTGKRNAEPTQQRAEEWIEQSGCRKGEAERRLDPGERVKVPIASIAEMAMS